MGRGERGRMDERVQSRVCPGDVQRELYFQNQNPEKYWPDGPLSPPIPLYYIHYHSSPITTHITTLHSIAQPFLFYFIFGFDLTHRPRFRRAEDPTDQRYKRVNSHGVSASSSMETAARTHPRGSRHCQLPRVEPSDQKYNQ